MSKGKRKASPKKQSGRRAELRKGLFNAPGDWIRESTDALADGAERVGEGLGNGYRSARPFLMAGSATAIALGAGTAITAVETERAAALVLSQGDLTDDERKIAEQIQTGAAATAVGSIATCGVASAVLTGTSTEWLMSDGIGEISKLITAFGELIPSLVELGG